MHINEQRRLREETANARPAKKSKPIVSNIGIIATILCAFLWLSAPFMAINRATLARNSGQPTALQIVTDDVSKLGDMTDSPVFWCALLSIIGIALCFFFNKSSTICFIAILTETTLATVMMIMLNSLGGDAGITEVAGIGYIGIFLLLMIVIVVNGVKWYFEKQSQ